MRFLYLDDSGKANPNHPSKCVVFGGFSVDESRWHSLTRQLTGAKARFFPIRGDGKPNDWEVKGTDFLTRNDWKRAKNRKFCREMAEILKRNECAVYAVWCRKANATQTLTDNWLVPKVMQVLASKFNCELEEMQTTGTIICDWSAYPLDRHVSNCLLSFMLAQRPGGMMGSGRPQLSRILGGVSYASSRSIVAIQACDIIAGAFRRFHEGASDHLTEFLAELRAMVRRRSESYDVDGFPDHSEVRLF